MPYHANGGSYCKAIEPAGGKAGDVIQDGQICCDGTMPYHANGGSYCKAIEPACVKAGDVIQDGQTCCDGAMPYHANGGSYCKAIVSKLGASLGGSGSASCQAEASPCTPSIACCDGLTCEKTPGGGWDMQCTAPPCVKA